MVRILITGKNSYIGNKFGEWVTSYQDDYTLTKISVRNNSWKKMDWSRYDVVINVAGIAHIKETEENLKEYYKVNRDLAIDLAKKAKHDQVPHFIQISTMSVFGKVNGTIDKNTQEQPINHYGHSKLEADLAIMDLKSKDFLVSIIRPPMVYGKESPGNYQRMSDFIKKTRAFPKINNERSMIFVNNLSEHLKKIIDNRLTGYFYPQNNEYLSTFDLAKSISYENNFRLLEIPNILNWTKATSELIPQAKKVFGDLVYDKELSVIYDKNNKPIKYNVADFKESVRLTEDEN